MTAGRVAVFGVAVVGAIVAAMMTFRSPVQPTAGPDAAGVQQAQEADQALFEVVPGLDSRPDSGVLSPELQDVVRVRGTYVGLSERGRAVVRGPTSQAQAFGDAGGPQVLERFVGQVAASEVIAVLTSATRALDIGSPVRLETLGSGADQVGYAVFGTDAGIPWTALQRLETSNIATSIHPNFVYRVSTSRVARATYDPWGFVEIGAPAAWSAKIDASKVVVAVVDSGLSYGLNAEDCISGNLWVNRNETPGNGTDDDNNGVADDINGASFTKPNWPTGVIDGKVDSKHGSQMARLIAEQEGCTLWGSQGVAVNAKLMIVRFLDGGNLAGEESAAKAIDYAATHRANIINISWSRDSPKFYRGTLLEVAIQRAVNTGALLVFGVGGGAADRDTAHSYPSAWQVKAGIPVVALRAKGGRLDAYGCASVQLGAPGVDIDVANAAGLESISGSSPAAAFVSGSAALTWAKLQTGTKAKITAGRVRSKLLGEASKTACDCRIDSCWSNGTNARLAIGFLK